MLGLRYYPEISRTQNVRVRDPRFIGSKMARIMVGSKDFPVPPDQFSQSAYKKRGGGGRREASPSPPHPRFLGSQVAMVTVISLYFLVCRIRVRGPRFPGPKMLGLRYYPEISWTQNVGLLGLGIRDFPDLKC